MTASIALIVGVLTLGVFIPSQFALEGSLTARPREAILVVLFCLAGLLSIPLAIDPAQAWHEFSDTFISTGGDKPRSVLSRTYQISDARAYEYKASIPPPVIQAAPKCNPKKDKYKCQSYNQHPNCPKNVAIGRHRQPPDPQEPPLVTGNSKVGSRRARVSASPASLSISKGT